jgi:hypothetical protein
MLGFEVREKLPCRPGLPLFHVFESLANSFVRVGAGGDIEQTLVGLGICTMAAALLFTMSTMGRLVFFNCFMKSPDRRRKVVNDWMSLVMSSMGAAPVKGAF